MCARHPSLHLHWIFKVTGAAGSFSGSTHFHWTSLANHISHNLTKKPVHITVLYHFEDFLDIYVNDQMKNKHLHKTHAIKQPLTKRMSHACITFGNYSNYVHSQNVAELNLQEKCWSSQTNTSTVVTIVHQSLDEDNFTLFHFTS